MGLFGRGFGHGYDRDFGRGEWGNRPDRWGYGAGPWRDDQAMRGGQPYDRGYRDFGRGYDRGYREDSHLRQPFPVRPSHSSMPMSHTHSRGGYDQGFFGIDYDRDMRAGGRGYGGRSRYDRNFGDFRNSYLTGWF